jgi:hypothetical protein
MSLLKIKGLTLSLAVTWSLGILLLGWSASYGWGDYLVDTLGSVYIGYRPTFFGSIIGAIWAFINGAIAGFCISYFYNFFSKIVQKKKKTVVSKKKK